VRLPAMGESADILRGVLSRYIGCARSSRALETAPPHLVNSISDLFHRMCRSGSSPSFVRAMVQVRIILFSVTKRSDRVRQLAQNGRGLRMSWTG